MVIHHYAILYVIQSFQVFLKNHYHGFWGPGDPQRPPLRIPSGSLAAPLKVPCMSLSTGGIWFSERLQGLSNNGSKKVAHWYNQEVPRTLVLDC